MQAQDALKGFGDRIDNVKSLRSGQNVGQHRGQGHAGPDDRFHDLLKLGRVCCCDQNPVLASFLFRFQMPPGIRRSSRMWACRKSKFIEVLLDLLRNLFVAY